MDKNIQDTLRKVLEAFMLNQNRDIWYMEEIVQQTAKDIADEYRAQNYYACSFDSPLGMDSLAILKYQLKSKYNIVYVDWNGQDGTRGNTTVYFKSPEDRMGFMDCLQFITDNNGYNIADNNTKCHKLDYLQ